MSKRNRTRVGSMVRHRERLLGTALDRLIKGKVSPEYVQERGAKLKEIRRSTVGKSDK